MQTVFGIGLVKSYQLKEGYMPSSNEHDFQMTCHNDGKWIDYQSGMCIDFTFIYFSEENCRAF